MLLNQSSVLVTGSTGFVGSRLCEVITQNVRSVRRAVRRIYGMQDEVVVSDLIDKTDWAEALKNIEIVIHLAARVHIMGDTAENPLAEFRKVNTDGTLNLARQAADAGVKRFIFISSIKVNGEMTLVDQSFKADDNFVPTDPYGLSKYEAEQGLLAIAKETGMEVVIIRPPLIYGPNVKANFASMMKWINKGIPLPFGAIHNQRSLVALDNLVDFIALCADREKSHKAANEVFLISDGEDVSTTTLLQKVARAFGKKPNLIPVPVGLMTFVAKLVGKGDIANRLFGSLQVDSSKARDLLGWQPVVTMDEQLAKMVEVGGNRRVLSD
jgi:nucleoside-diphosphate-sugar epimerase